MSNAPTAQGVNKMAELNELPGIIDAYQRQREARLAKEKEAEVLKAAESQLKEAILSTLRESETEAIGGTTHLAKRVVQDEPTVEDWDVLWDHVLATREFDLIQRRVTPTAVKERWDQDVEVPGIGSFPVEKLSLTKL